MNEITRIHLAKVPYEIEISAKKELAGYLKALETYADDEDWLQDIEIRITEILADKSINRNGLITKKDIEAVRAQLGEPSDFFGDGDIALGTPAYQPDVEYRRLYRDPSTALLGGVLSGIGQYLKVNPIWIRLAFIVLLFVSFGVVSVVYIVLWILLPPASSVAAQVELSGKPVTIASLKNHRDEAGTITTNPTAKLVQSTIVYIAGAIMAAMSAGALILTIFAGVSLFSSNNYQETLGLGTSAGAVESSVAISLFVISGFLLSTLGGLLAASCFRKKFGRKTAIAVVAIIAAGILSFGSGIGMAAYGSWRENERSNITRETKKVKLDNELAGTKRLVFEVTSDNKIAENSIVQVQYVVSSTQPRYELTTNHRTTKMTPEFSRADGATTRLNIKLPNGRQHWDGFQSQPIITIYGPALEAIEVKSGVVNYTNSQKQELLKIDAIGGSAIVSGSFNTVNLSQSKSIQETSLIDSSIENLTIDLKSGRVEAGVVLNLGLTLPSSCPGNRVDDDEVDRIEIKAVTSGKIIVNGQEAPAKSITTACGSLVIGGDSDRDRDFRS